MQSIEDFLKRNIELLEQVLEKAPAKASDDEKPARRSRASKEDDADDEKPARRSRASKEDDADDEKPARRSRASKEDDEDEKPARRSRASKEDDADDEKPARRSSRRDKAEDGEASGRKSRNTKPKALKIADVRAVFADFFATKDKKEEKARREFVEEVLDVLKVDKTTDIDERDFQGAIDVVKAYEDDPDVKIEDFFPED